MQHLRGAPGRPALPAPGPGPQIGHFLLKLILKITESDTEGPWPRKARIPLARLRPPTRLFPLKVLIKASVINSEKIFVAPHKIK